MNFESYNSAPSHEDNNAKKDSSKLKAAAVAGAIAMGSMNAMASETQGGTNADQADLSNDATIESGGGMGHDSEMESWKTEGLPAAPKGFKTDFEDDRAMIMQQWEEERAALEAERDLFMRDAEQERRLLTEERRRLLEERGERESTSFQSERGAFSEIDKVFAEKLPGIVADLEETRIEAERALLKGLVEIDKGIVGAAKAMEEAQFQAGKLWMESLGELNKLTPEKIESIQAETAAKEASLEQRLANLQASHDEIARVQSFINIGSIEDAKNALTSALELSGIQDQDDSAMIVEMMVTEKINRGDAMSLQDASNFLKTIVERHINVTKEKLEH